MSITAIHQFGIENVKAKESEVDPLESVLHHAGDWGLYQKLLLLCMFPFGVICCFVYFVQIFITATPQGHWCKVPELEHLDLELRRNLSTQPSINGEWLWDRCMTYDANWTEVLETLKPPVNVTTVPCKHGWEFLMEDIPYQTVVTERDWVCDSAQNVPTAQSMFFIGSIVGGVLFGWLADKYGRIPALVGANLIGFVGGIASMFTAGLWDFAFCRLLVGMSFDSCFFLLYILVLEYVGPRHRTLTANLSLALYYGGGCVALPWLALWLADWRTLLLLTSAPMLIVLAVPFVVPESARWLSSSGKINRLLKTLKRIEKINGTKIPQDVLDEFLVSSRQTKHTDESIVALLKSKQLRAIASLLVVASMAVSVLFDGLVRISGNLGYDFFISFTFASLTEIPALLLLALTLDKYGRRKLTAIPLAVAGILCLLTVFVPKGLPQVSLAVIARFFINMGFTTMTQWSTELLPTPVRASGSALVHISGFIASVLSPFIVYSERVWRPLPLLIMCALSLLAGGLAVFLPETTGRSLPQNIAEGERLFDHYSICGKPERDDIETEKQISDKEKSLIT